MLIKVRLVVLGLLSVMAFGAVASTVALASPGPFWWHRNNSKEGAGVKLAEGSTEQYKGAGETTVFKSEEGGVKFTLAGETQVKGDIWNEPNQGQIKAQVTFPKVKVTSPAELTSCKVKVTVPVDYVGHLMWKYRGNKEELSQEGTQESHGQKWDVVLYPANTKFTLKEGELSEKNTFAEIKFALESACAAFQGLTLKPKGLSGFADKALNLEEFTKKATVEFPGHEVWQHFWNGTEVATLKGVLEQGAGHPAFFEGTLPFEFEKQEIDIHEK